MCGIAGIYCYNSQYRVEEKILTQMRDTMMHRGPDGGANWVAPDRRVGLAHRRLSIIDLSTAATQPMPNEDETVWVIFNGEIYNHLGLRRELSAAGHRFRTDHSDTEVLVHGYEQWGIAGLLERIEGDYGFALWDCRKESLYLVRDRIGVKPLYFSLQDGMLLFASEIKAIVAHPAVERDVDPLAMYHYLSFLTTPAPLTMFKGVYKLPAGHYLEISKTGAFRATRYWDAVPGRGIPRGDIAGLDWPAREQYYVRGIRERLTGAVEKRMMSDVPFGVFLSGGIDSSTNVALMSQYMDRPIDTFTVGFKDHQHLNELAEAELVAKQFKTNHHQVLIDEHDMRVIWTTSSTIRTSPSQTGSASRSTSYPNWPKTAASRSCRSAKAPTNSSAATPATWGTWIFTENTGSHSATFCQAAYNAQSPAWQDGPQVCAPRSRCTPTSLIARVVIVNISGVARPSSGTF